MLLNTNCFAAFEKSEINAVKMIKIGEAEKHLKYYREDRGYSTYVVCSIVGFYENNIFHPAYCMNKELPGAEEGSYEISVSEVLKNPKVKRVISQGYPYKTYQEMGLTCAADAFTVTKFAVYCVLGESKLEYYSAEENDEIGMQMLNVLKQLVEYGNNENVLILEGDISLEKVGDIKEGERFYYQEYKVNSDIDMKEYKLYNLKNFPERSYVANTQNVYQGEFLMGENFRILIPKTEFTKTINGTIEIGGKLKNYPVFYGKAPNGKQDYVLTFDSYGEIIKKFDLNLDINTGRIKVIKIDGESYETLEGVKFELLNENEEKILEGITNIDGEIYFENLYPGNYYIKEVETLEEYEINSEVFEIELKYGIEAEVIVENYKKEIEKEPIEEVKAEVEVEEIIEVVEPPIEEGEKIPALEIKLPKTGM